ncbi:unnamed protein product [Discula destructiva]
MGRNLRPTRVHQTVKRSLQIPNTNTTIEIPPVWLKVLERYPPAEILTRPKPTVHQEPHPTKRRRPRNLFHPQPITYPEDELRRIFFKDHPWELARPRIAVELDGKDGRYVDWSRGLRQPGVMVSGESVVQRQLWLMENGLPQYVENEATGDRELIHKPVTREQAYDMVRKEFYAIRQQQEITRRVAAEEARMVGAYFGKSRLEVGMELEGKTFDRWKAWAQEENAKLSADRASAYANFNSADDESAAADLALLENDDQDGLAAAPAPPAQ